MSFVDGGTTTYVQCTRCGYWSAPTIPHTWEKCAENFRMLVKEAVRERDEYKVRADLAEETIEDMKRVLRDV